jgi:hypothetical protein
VKGILRIFAGFLFIGSIYGYFILQQSTESGSERNLPIVAMVFGALICGVLSMGGKSKYDPSGNRGQILRTVFLIFLCLSFAAYYFFFAHKP